MCHDDSMDLGFQIETGKKDVARAKATIADEEAKIGAAEAKIEELSTSIATSTKDLESATAKTGFIQGKAGQEAMSKVMDALEAVIVSAGVNSADKVKVQALLQATQGDSDSDLALQPGGAPDPAAYKSKSGGILSVLEDMLEKAKAELASAQKAEMNSAFDFKMLKQKIEDAVAFGEKTLAETKSAKAAAEEAKAVAEGELETASKNLSDDETHLKDLQQECMTAAEEDTESKTSRAEELEALGTAKKILEEKTGAAADRAYSFIQIGTVSKAGTKTKEVKQHVLDLLQSLAQKNDDKQLSLLAQRCSPDRFGSFNSTENEIIDGQNTYCAGFGKDFTQDTNALCLPREECERLCTKHADCHSIDMHRVLPQCYLNTFACEDTSKWTNSAEWDIIIKTVTPTEATDITNDELRDTYTTHTGFGDAPDKYPWDPYDPP